MSCGFPAHTIHLSESSTGNLRLSLSLSLFNTSFHEGFTHGRWDFFGPSRARRTRAWPSRLPCKFESGFGHWRVLWNATGHVLLKRTLQSPFAGPLHDLQYESHSISICVSFSIVSTGRFKSWKGYDRSFQPVHRTCLRTKSPDHYSLSAVPTTCENRRSLSHGR